jgi:hypothetical protein
MSSQPSHCTAIHRFSTCNIEGWLRQLCRCTVHQQQSCSRLRKRSATATKAHRAFTGTLQPVCSNLCKSMVLAQGSYTSILRVQRADNPSRLATSSYNHPKIVAYIDSGCHPWGKRMPQGAIELDMKRFVIGATNDCLAETVE